MRGLLACREMTNATKRDGHAADAGVIVVPRAQGGPDEFYEVRMVWEEGVLPERSERFSSTTLTVRLSWICRSGYIWKRLKSY